MTGIKISEFHSHRQKRDIRLAAHAIMRGGDVSLRTAYLVLHQVVMHGLDEFDELEACLGSLDKQSPRGARHRAELKKEYLKVREIRQSVPAKLLHELEDRLLTEEKPTFIQGRTRTAETAVVFLTAFNNFYLSNVVLALSLLELGYSVLLLKSERKSQFLNGIDGFGPTWNSSLQGLKSFLDDCPGAYRITGFSSGGYASILATLSLAPTKYIGFSVCGDLQIASPYPAPPHFDRLVRGNTPKTMHRNLVREALHTKTPMTVIAGALDSGDAQHANAFRAVPMAQVKILPDVGHMTVRSMFLKGDLFPELAS